jgi:RND family efflux transporter MFP subunit
MMNVIHLQIVLRIAIGSLLTLVLPESASGQVPVTIKTLQEVGIFPVYSAPATVISLNDAQVSAEVAGVVIGIPVQVGDSVDAGDIIAKLDCQSYVFETQQAQALLNSARAAAEFARFQADNARQLQQSRSISAEMLNERQTQAKKADAEVDHLAAGLKVAERRVEKCTIRAPFKAVIIERKASIGEMLAPGSVVMRLLDRDRLEVSGRIQEQDLARLQAAENIRFVSGQQVYPLRVRATIPFVDSRIRSYQVRFSFTGARAAPGEAGRVEWVSARPSLPSDLLVRRGEALGVFIAEREHARFQVIPNAQEGQPAEPNLSSESPVIIDGRFRLMDGDAIRIVVP